MSGRTHSRSKGRPELAPERGRPSGQGPRAEAMPSIQRGGSRKSKTFSQNQAATSGEPVRGA